MTLNAYKIKFMQLKKAADIAVSICEQLQPFTERINIAGSIRRQKPEVKDIEIVCLPGYISQQKGDLFGTKEVMVIHPKFVEMVGRLGEAIKGTPTGRYMQIELCFFGINLDLFMPDRDDYYRQYAIRTGSADYAARTIAAGWKKKGWCGSDKGLRLQKDCLEVKGPDGKSKWTCIDPHAEKPPAWVSEADFFSWLGVPLIMPKLRLI